MRKPRIVIAGGHPSAFKSCDGIATADVRHWRVEESIHLLTSAAKRADLTIIMSNYINHKCIMALKKANASITYHGTSSGLRERVEAEAQKIVASRAGNR